MIKYYKQDDILNLFTKLNVNYLTNYIFETEVPNNYNFYLSDYYIDNQKEFDLLCKKYSSYILNNKKADLYITKTEKKGFGLFANSNIKKGDFIGLYLGIVREEDEFVEYDENGFGTDYAWDFPDLVENIEPLEINARYSGNEMRFANHDTNYNLDVEHTIVNNMWYIFFVANRNIEKDEELTIFYGEDYWDTEYRTVLN
ncbi:MAG: SET domain-containing protein-lysine N-methyltransferase [Spirochaetales bacterium]|nr:SET domain-containing protein-lysine N-methyltransferase [Spirochaetales bacterium]